MQQSFVELEDLTWLCMQADTGETQDVQNELFFQIQNATGFPAALTPMVRSSNISLYDAGLLDENAILARRDSP